MFCSEPLFREDAVKMWKAFTNFGKKFKRPIPLRRGCQVCEVVWQVPEQNDLRLPSRVFRYFKKVLPSKNDRRRLTEVDWKWENKKQITQNTNFFFFF